MKHSNPEREREFAELRDANERVRRQFVQTELETCLTTVQIGEFEASAGNVPIAEKEVANAEKAIRTVERFMPAIAEDHRLGLQAKLQEVQSRLSDLKAHLRSRRKK